MSREIKFRAWDKQEKKWYKPVYEAWQGKLYEILISMSGDIIVRRFGDLGYPITEHESLPQYRDRFILQQFTGLLDRNGKEIYDGDILRVDDGDKWFYEVVFLKYGWGFKFRNEIELTMINDLHSHMEIIGNIYEKPELIPNETH